MRSYTTPLRRRDKVSRGCRRGGRTSEKHRHDTSSVPQAAGIVIYMRDTCNALCDFFSRRSLSLSLSRAYSCILSVPPRDLTIVSRDRTTLRRNASNEITATTTTTTSSLEICFFVWPRSFFFPLSVVIAIVFVVVNLVLSRVLAPRGA